MKCLYNVHVENYSKCRCILWQESSERTVSKHSTLTYYSMCPAIKKKNSEACQNATLSLENSSIKGNLMRASFHCLPSGLQFKMHWYTDGNLQLKRVKCMQCCVHTSVGGSVIFDGKNNAALFFLSKRWTPKRNPTKPNITQWGLLCNRLGTGSWFPLITEIATVV